MAKMSDDDKADGPFEIIGLLLAVSGILIAMLWFFASNRIVYFWTPVLSAVGSWWDYVPGGVGAELAEGIRQRAAVFMQRPVAVGFFAFTSFANTALAPLTTMLVAGVTVWLLATVFMPGANVFRRFKRADDLLERMSYVFTGTAPILHLRKALANHTEPLWKRQTFPEEVLLKHRVNGKPLVVNGEANERHIKAYFEGLLGDGRGRGGLMVSTMLGRQVVNLTDDADRSRKAGAFPDRFSDAGKVIFGLLCARAFGGEQGKADYNVARDQLNNSCRGSKHGLPKLPVAQWIFDKYRAHPMAHRLFAVHHWEYTYLFALLAQAKRQGKCGHWEFLWLKPTDRILFYALNTVGRGTPHTESAAVFNQFAYERKVSAKGRFPLTVNAQGKLEHVIFVRGAIEGLVAAWRKWTDGVDATEEWWEREDQWRVIQGVRLDTAPIPPEAAPDTEFDRAQEGARADAENRRRELEAGEIAAFALHK